MKKSKPTKPLADKPLKIKSLKDRRDAYFGKPLAKEKCPSCGGKLHKWLGRKITRISCGMCPYETTENNPTPRTMEDVINAWDYGKGCLMDYDIKGLTYDLKLWIREKIGGMDVFTVYKVRSTKYGEHYLKLTDVLKELCSPKKEME